MKVEQFKRHIIDEIKAAKEKKGMSLEQLSAKTEEYGEFVSTTTILRILSDGGVKLDLILSVADALEIPYDKDEAEDVLQLEVEHLHQSLTHAYERITSQTAQIGNMRKVVDGIETRANHLSRCLRVLTGVTGLSTLVLGYVAVKEHVRHSA